MSVLTSAPYSLPRGTLIKATYEALNEYGLGVASGLNTDTNGAKAQTVPGTPTASPTLVSQSESAIALTMPAMTTDAEIGSSVLTSYNLLYNGGGSSTTFTSLVGENPADLTTSFTKSGLTANTEYTFKYRVQNKHGWGGYSPDITVRAATLPGQIDTVVFSVQSSTSVRIAWSDPTSTGGSPITSYLIQIKKKDTTMATELTYCDGTSTTVISNKYCDIPFTTLRASPNLLVLDDLVEAQITAINAVGSGTASTINTSGVTIQTEPQAPASGPTVSTYNEYGATVSFSAISGSAAGSATVTNYELSWNNGTSGVGLTWSTYTNTLSNSIVVAGFTSGESYQFKYRAQNIHGWGDYSSILTVVAMSEPSTPDAVTTSLDGTGVRFTWTEPYTGGTGVVITEYHLLIQKADTTWADYNSTCDGTDTTIKG